MWEVFTVGIVQEADTTFREWWRKTSQTNIVDQLNLVTMTCWMIWNNWNSALWTNRHREANQVCHSASSLLHEWTQAQVLAHLLIEPPKGAGDKRWVPSAMNTLKCNVDAALSSHSNMIGFGFVIRNQR